MELSWKNKNKSIYIDYENDSKLQWVPKDDVLINEIREFLPLHTSGTNSKKLSLTNCLILGDNIFALNTLKNLFENIEDNKKCKFVYIDPPYNTFNPELSYKDNLLHEEWLSFMQDRLERIKGILRPDGIICIQIDDREYARLYLLMIELFGEKNLKSIVVKMSESSGLKMQTAKYGGIPKLKEYLIIAKMDGIQGFHFEPVVKKELDPEYNIFIKNFTAQDKERIIAIQNKENISEEDGAELDQICKKFVLVPLNKVFEDYNKHDQSKITFFKDNAWRICRTASSSSIFKLTEAKKRSLSKPQQIFTVISKKGMLYFVKSDYTPDARKPRVQILFADEHLTTPLGDLWTDIKTTGLEFEGNIDFKNGKKPEKLLRRLIKGTTDEDDLILDLFGGSGTTASVALELKRNFISIEVNSDIFNISMKRIANKITELKKTNSDQEIKINYYKVGPSKSKKN